MKLKFCICALLVFTGLFPGLAHATNCAGLPTTFTGNQFPTGNFFSNFDSGPNASCYLIPFATGSGGTSGGDLNSIYSKIFYKVNPAYQLIIVGSFPNARYFSITDYDEHSAPAQFILDENIVPLTSSYINPYLPGASWVPGQKFAASVSFEGTPGTQQKGCEMNGFNVSVNQLDVTYRHAGMDWNSNPNVWAVNPSFGLHIVDTPQHTNPNGAGVIMLRNYLDITPAGSPSPYVIVRDVASGCAYPAAYAMQTLQIVTNNQDTGNAWLNSQQADLHRVYENDYLQPLCFASNPQSILQWERGTEYVPGAIPDGSYVTATVKAGEPATLASAGRVMRVRFQIPTTPLTPCASGCSRTGNEQLRYMSISFQNGGTTLASVADNAFTNVNGNVTLIVGTGATIPAWITPANGYTYLNLTTASGYLNLSELNMRNLEPASTFNCSGEIVPYDTAEYTPPTVTGTLGGLMGGYAPVVDYPLAADLATTAGPPPAAGGCAVFPVGKGEVAPSCGVVTDSAIAINTVTTQCPAPGCDQVFVQTQPPPMSIIGVGFGNFTNGLPFAGTSNYLEITDITQKWSAGYSGDACTVAITSWADYLIQLVANVNQNGVCPMAAQDQITVTVWNPESLTSATIGPITVQPN
jgi:hypothetical protein